jgi:[lysine-biosynthesis-protein LysW]---L-2-aminoadipate ligase
MVAGLELDSVRAGGLAQVALVASRVRFEEKLILEALEARAIPHAVLDPRTTPIALDGITPPWEVALVREIAHTRALHAALALEGLGFRTVNRARAIETCGDKWRTALALREAGLPAPRTVLALSPEAVSLAAEELGYPVVLKPLHGSWGRRVVLLRDAEEAGAVLEYCAALPAPQARVLCVQEPIDKPGRDVRVIVVGGEPLGATYRLARDWRTNVALGAESRPCRLDADVAGLAVAAAGATGAEIAGVDLLEGRGGELYVLEVNAGVEFRGFVSACDVDVAGAIVDYVTARVRA